VSRKFIFPLLIAACFACSDNKNESRKIAGLQDRRQTDSLLLYLDNKAAQLAFGSVQDTNAIEKLAAYKTEEAAFALGQMYNAKAVPFLKGYPNAYEALGKCITKDDLAVFDVQTSDTSALSEIAWGIYRAGVRGVFDSTSINKALSILANKQAGRSARLGAAQFFSRVQFGKDRIVGQALVVASNGSDPEIRMAVVNALAKVAGDLSIDGITPAVEDPDYRVRVNAARALRTQSLEDVQYLFQKLLNDSNAHVSVATAEILRNLKADTIWIHQQAKTARNRRTQAILYSKLNNVNREAKAIYINSNNDYQKSELLNAISDVGFLFDQYKNNEAKVIKSTAAARIAELSSDIKIYKQIIADGDQGSLIPICASLVDTTRGFKESVTDYSFLEEAKDKLSLPRDYETYVPLERALNYFKGLPPPPAPKNEYNHPIDWTVANTISKDQKVLIKTSKGDIIMQLFIDEAPASVVNFVTLVNSKYFDGRFFHRVVPNFVAQTGCNRGDGFGSEDYSIRSEFSQRRYKTGSVGMASAGKDTEGTQWFITHSPTPHLDGKYTIFAEVVSGMDVVHQIELGDKIIEARLIK
jgi:cyclophilin family peptidyl-prolyl cis-trans isomerase